MDDQSNIVHVPSGKARLRNSVAHVSRGHVMRRTRLEREEKSGVEESKERNVVKAKVHNDDHLSTRDGQSFPVSLHPSEVGYDVA